MATTASAVINTTDTATNTPTVPDASATTKWQEYIWVRHLAGDDVADKAKFYVWNPSITSVTDGLKTLKWQEVTAAAAFSDLTGSATIAQLPTGITVSNLSIDGAITNTHLAGGITNANLAGSILYDKITSVNASAVTSVSGSKIPVNTIPTGLTNTNIDSILGSASVDWDKVNVDDGEIPGAKIKDSLVHGQIASVSATTITTGTLPPARLLYMFERNLPIDSVANASGTYNLHTALATASADFEGIIRVIAQTGSNEVIIALPHPSVTSYNQKAAKLSIYRGASPTPGKVTIKVCKSGTDSSLLFDAVFTDATCDTNGNTTINCDSTAKMEVGQKVTGTGIVADPVTTITVKDNETTFTISQAATTDLDNQTLTFTSSGLIVDNNNGELTDEVVVLPALTENKARKIVVDLVSDCLAGAGQWIISGGAPASGVGVSSQAGLAVGQEGGTSAADGLITSNLEVTGKETVNTANLGTDNDYDDIAKWAVEAEVDTWQIQVPGSGYALTNRFEIAATQTGVTTAVTFEPAIIDTEGGATNRCLDVFLLSSNRGVFSKNSGDTFDERLYPLTTLTGFGTGSGAQLRVRLRGIAPAEVDIGEKFYDPWRGGAARVKT